MDFERNVLFDAEGLAVCRASEIRERDVEAAHRICRKSIVGSGNASFGVESPGETPSTISSQLTLFNGGVKDGITTLLIYGFVVDPARMPLVAVIKISKAPQGPRGWHAVGKIPPSAEGKGSLLDFKLKVGRRFWHRGEMRSYFAAKCPNGHLTATFSELLFRNEAKQPGVPSTTVLKGTKSLPCTPMAEKESGPSM